MSVPNSWETMRMTVSNSFEKAKLKFDDIRDLILAKKVRKIDSCDFLGSRSALNVNN